MHQLVWFYVAILDEGDRRTTLRSFCWARLPELRGAVMPSVVPSPPAPIIPLLGCAGKRLKSIYRHLAASDRAEANAALHILAAVAGRGATSARLLLAAFDWEHKVLAKLARPAGR